MLSLRERLALLSRTTVDIKHGRLVFDPNKAKFGMVNFDKLFDVNLQEEIKGFPCVAYNHMSDPIKFGIKVNPLENKYNAKDHPCRIEAMLLREFTKCVTNGITPHITYYFCDMDVFNTQNAITKFPLKLMRHNIHKMCSVIVSEFVPGGSVEDWVQRVDPTVEQWRYIIFSAIWTLVVLQDMYRFIHRDFHFGNVLIDNSVDPNDKTVLTYRLELGDGQTTTWYVPNCGILPKVWDFEFGNVYKRFNVPPNRFGNWGDSMPDEFNPYYDIHFLLTTLLELDLPQEIQDFIFSVYPAEFIPDLGHGSDCSTCSSSSRSNYSTCSSRSNVSQVDVDVNVKDVDVMDVDAMHLADLSGSEWEECTTSSDDSSSTESVNDLSFHDIYYITDEEDTLSQHTIGSKDSSGSSGHSSSCESCSECSRSSCGRRSSSSGSSSSSSCRGVKTEYLAGDRMRNDAHIKYQGRLPTPLTLLTHDFFRGYRRAKTFSKQCILPFKYKLTSKIDELR